MPLFVVVVERTLALTYLVARASGEVGIVGYVLGADVALDVAAARCGAYNFIAAVLFNERRLAFADNGGNVSTCNVEGHTSKITYLHFRIMALVMASSTR